ncbi:MAG TPA: hypothetical protein VK427_21665 [Kofleriaceae bacterium]|nr:hypothetical protein [Kofleriaceae bacterium]
MSFRKHHRHLFAWVVLGGGVIVVALLAFAVLAALGVTGLLADGYFALAAALLPAGWLATFKALPGIVHVLLVVVSLGVLAAVAGELFD